MEGFLCINKPLGATSHHIVCRARRLLGTKKIGHTGTLDPLATGVLILCVGSVTRLSEYIQCGEKEYKCRMLLGIGTDSFDGEGRVTADVPAGHIGPEHIRAALPSLTGSITQTPPAFSAVKQNGVPLYKLARQGIEVEPPARNVFIHSLTLEAFEADPAHPCAVLSVVCSEGTYIRSLVRDLGRRLGIPASVSGLHRTRNGGFSDSEAVDPDLLEGLTPREIEERYLLPPSTICRYMPHSYTRQAEKLRYGLPADFSGPDCGLVAALDGDRVVALGYAKGGKFYPKKVLIQ